MTKRKRKIRNSNPLAEPVKKTAKRSNSSKAKKWVGWSLAAIAAVAYSWIFYSNFVEPFGLRWRALYGDPNYPKGYDIHGIDISHHQGKIDWAKLRNAMIDKTYIRFVMVKATEGGDYVDEYFHENFKEAKEAGFIRGAYHFYSTLSPAREQAYFFLDNVKLESGDLPPVLDVEGKPEGMPDADFQVEILTWLHIVEDRYHTKPIIYTNHKFKLKYLSDQRFDDYPYWIAHYYVPEVQYKGKWKFWQFTDIGLLPGIDGYVDLDIYSGSAYDLQKLTIKSLEEENDANNTEENDSTGNYNTNDSIAQPSDSVFD